MRVQVVPRESSVAVLRVLKVRLDTLEALLASVVVAHAVLNALLTVVQRTLSIEALQQRRNPGRVVNLGSEQTCPLPTSS